MLEWGSFTDLVSDKFIYLINEYNCSIIPLEQFYDSPTEDFMVVFQNDTCRIEVIDDRGEVSVKITSLDKNIINRKRTSLLRLIRAKNPGFKLRFPYDMDSGENWKHVVDQVIEQADLLRFYGDHILRGDFSGSGAQ